MELQTLLDALHTTKAKIKPADGAEEEIHVIYRPFTPVMLRQIEEMKLDPSKTIADQAALVVRELPDLTRDGQPVAPTLELFESLDSRHATGANKSR